MMRCARLLLVVSVLPLCAAKCAQPGGEPATHSISGKVTGLVNTTIELRGPGPAGGDTPLRSIQTASAYGSGGYVFSDLADGDYTVVPSPIDSRGPNANPGAYKISPTSRTVTLSGADVTDQDFQWGCAGEEIGCCGLSHAATADQRCLYVYCVPPTFCSPSSLGPPASTCPEAYIGLCMHCAVGYHPCGVFEKAYCAKNTDIATCGPTCTPCPAPANAEATCSGQYASVCGFACKAGYHLCADSCASNADVASCGASCTPCPVPANAVATCDGTSCGFACNTGYHACGDACASNADLATCGASCTPCPAPPAHALATCDGTTCGFACDAGFHACGGACASNADLATCGASCTPCPAPPAHALATCDGTACGFACDPGFQACGAACCLAAPSNPTATPGPARVTLSWDPVDTATGYHVYWSTSPGVTPANGTPVSIAAPPFVHQPLMPTVPIYYAVAAMLPTGEGPLSTEVSAAPLRPYGVMAARYPANGAGWNDYVKNDGASRLTASDAACDPVGDIGGYASCLHGGEMRAFTAIYPTDCAGVTAEDDAVPGGALEWVCDSSAGGFRMVSTGLKEGRFLSDLLARNEVTNVPDWKELVIRVWKDGVVVTSTSPAAWWSNPVVEVFSQSQLSLSGAIYVAGAARWKSNQQLTVTAPRVALLAERGTDLFNVSAYDQPFLWIEGTLGMMNGFGPALGVWGFNHSVIRGLSALSCIDCPVLLLDGRDSTVSDVTTALGTGSQLHTQATTYARLHFTGGFSYGTTDAPFPGVAVGGQNNVLTQVAVSGGAWLALGDATSLGGQALLGFTGANTTPTVGSPYLARLLSVSGGNTLAQLALTNGDVGMVVDGPGNRIFDVATCDNGVHGLEDWAAGTWWAGWLVVGDNGSSDCWEAGGTPTCPTGPTLATGCSLGGAFVGKVAAPDGVNQSASNPAGDISGVTDWTHFVDRWRGWGADSAEPFPAAANRGRCWPGGDCRMWDWSLVAGPAWLIGNAQVRLWAHPWYRATPPTSQADCDVLVRGSIFVPSSPPSDNICHSVILLGAVEIAGDGLGNDNGLCENGETCQLAPNIGAYQGHGRLVFHSLYEPVPGFRVTLLVREWISYSPFDPP